MTWNYHVIKMWDKCTATEVIIDTWPGKSLFWKFYKQSKPGKLLQTWAKFWSNSWEAHFYKVVGKVQKIWIPLKVFSTEFVKISRHRQNAGAIARSSFLQSCRQGAKNMNSFRGIFHRICQDFQNNYFSEHLWMTLHISEWA